MLYCIIFFQIISNYYFFSSHNVNSCCDYCRGYCRKYNQNSSSSVVLEKFIATNILLHKVEHGVGCKPRIGNNFVLVIMLISYNSCIDTTLWGGEGGNGNGIVDGCINKYGLANRPMLVKCYDNKKVKSPG